MSDLVLRPATANDAEGLWTLIHAHQREGHLLPRELSELRRHAPRFVVAELPAGANDANDADNAGDRTDAHAAGHLVACAELAPLSDRVAEVRSLVVSNDVRRVGLASRLIGELQARARTLGFDTLCAFTHDARFFVRQNFSIVPHTWLPEKIHTDCVNCPLFRKCEQYAMLLPLTAIARYTSTPAAAARAAVA